MPNYYSNPYMSMNSSNNNASVWLILSIILAVIGGIVVYLLFLNKKNEGKFKGFVGWLYEFLSFKKMLLEIILRVTYLIIAIYITLSSFAMIGVSGPVAFFVYLIGGNIVARILYEFLLLLMVICRNIVDINNKLKADPQAKKVEEKVVEKVEE